MALADCRSQTLSANPKYGPGSAVGGNDASESGPGLEGQKREAEAEMARQAAALKKRPAGGAGDTRSVI